MEGSVAAGGAQGGDAGAQGTGENAGGFDAASAFAEMQQAIRGVGETQAQMMERLQSTAQDDGQEQADDGLDLSFLDPSVYGDPQTDPNQMAQQLEQVLAQNTDSRVQAAVQPVLDRLNEVQTRLDAADLVAEIPEMGNEETAKQVVTAAHQWAQNIGQPELANNPQVWRMVYMATKAAEIANQEGSEQPGAAHLEGGSGATPGSNSQVDPGDLIVNAQGNNGARLPF